MAVAQIHVPEWRLGKWNQRTCGLPQLLNFEPHPYGIGLQCFG